MERPEHGIDFERELNSEQLATVTAPDGPLFVLAAAGTGKTRTLVYRVAFLMQKGIESGRILLLTFTNRAAKEMLSRADSLVRDSVGGLWGGTFHHMANRILRQHAELLGYGLDFTILDRDDSVSLVKACLSELKLKGKDFPKAEVIMSLMSGAVNKRMNLREAVEQRFESHPVDTGAILRVMELYRSKKNSQNAMDFDDLLINGLRLFQEHSGVLEKYREKFLYVLVDEYQDTNPLQADWVDLIASRHRNLMVVGDDFQSIYSWRGADYRNIMTFTERYPDAKTFMLETNYRSAPEILEVANCCIAGNTRQFRKVLRASRREGEKPSLALLRDGAHQARYVVEQIHSLRCQGRAWRDIAVLYRSHYHSVDLQMELSRERMPYAVVSGVRFFEQAHLKDVCSLLRVLHNPLDQLAFFRLLSLLPGVSSGTAGKIWKKLGGRFDYGNEAALGILRSSLPARAAGHWQKILPVIRDYDRGLKSDPAEAVSRFCEAFYGRYASESFDDYERRMEDLAGAMEFMSDFSSNEDFLNEVALVSNLDAEGDRIAAPDGDCIRLSTVHQAKGKEWRSVFVLWLAEGMFPSSRSLAECGDEEERRLFYVAVTRAKDELFLCAPVVRRDYRGASQMLQPSRFVGEIPDSCLAAQRVGFL